MTEYTYKTYKCVWEVQFVVVDQYGAGTIDEVYERSEHPTREEAIAHKLTVAHEHKYVQGRWIPNNATNSNQEAIVRYREVLVK